MLTDPLDRDDLLLLETELLRLFDELLLTELFLLFEPDLLIELFLLFEELLLIELLFEEELLLIELLLLFEPLRLMELFRFGEEFRAIALSLLPAGRPLFTLEGLVDFLIELFGRPLVTVPFEELELTLLLRLTSLETELLLFTVPRLDPFLTELLSRLATLFRFNEAFSSLPAIPLVVPRLSSLFLRLPTNSLRLPLLALLIAVFLLLGLKLRFRAVLPSL